jgi:hypothetical protein
MNNPFLKDKEFHPILIMQRNKTFLIEYKKNQPSNDG